jgi:hypothetical protein
MPGAGRLAPSFVPVAVGGEEDRHGRGEGEKPNDEQEQMAGFAGNHESQKVMDA